MYRSVRLITPYLQQNFFITAQILYSVSVAVVERKHLATQSVDEVVKKLL